MLLSMLYIFVNRNLLFFGYNLFCLKHFKNANIAILS